MKLSLVVNEGVHKGKVIAIPHKQFLIGRDAQCHLRPASNMISKRHCALMIRGDKIFIHLHETAPVVEARPLAAYDSLAAGGGR